MNKNFLIGITMGVLMTALFFGGMTTRAEAPATGEKPAETPAKDSPVPKTENDKEKDKAKDGTPVADETKPKENYEYYPDVHSLDELKEEPISDASADPGVKIVYKIPETCKEFSLYLESKQKKLEMYEHDLKVREEIMTRMQQQFDASTSKYSETETRVRKLMNADPMSLKDNPEVAKMIKLYESLAAEDSAERLKNLDLDLTYAILKGMQAKKLSKIMTAMDPKLSAALSSRLVRGF
jgi:flagellar motility protein MotE (MotC chaperone)